MLKLEFRDQSRKPFWVMEDDFSIGSSRENSLIIDDPSIAPVHLRILSQDHTFILRPANHDFPVEVNGKVVEQININCGDEIKLGDLVLIVVDPLEHGIDNQLPFWSLIADASWLSGQEFPFQAAPGERLVVGRSNQCDIVFAGTYLSRQHAEITMGENSLKIRDLDSANGTFVNGKQIREATLSPGDHLRLDVYSFRVFGPGADLPPSADTTRLRTSPKDLANNHALSGSKSWKTKPTSPGNREEPTHYQSKTFTWVSGGIILALFFVALYIVLGN